MGKIKFGNMSAKVVIETLEDKMQVIKSERPEYLTTMQSNPTQYVEVPKIVYVDKPLEIIKTVEVEKIVYQDRVVEKIVEVIKEIEKPIIVEKIVLVEAANLNHAPTITTVEVEKIVEVQVTNPINNILIFILALSALANVLQGLL